MRFTVLVLLSFLLVGCAAVTDVSRKALDQSPVHSNEIASSDFDLPPITHTPLNTKETLKLNIPKQVQGDFSKLKAKHLSLSVYDTPISDILYILNQKTNIMVSSDLADNSTYSLSYDGTLDEFLKSLASMTDAVVQYDGSAIKLKKDMVADAVLPTFMRNQQGAIKSDDLSRDLKPDNFIEIIKDAAENIGVTVDVVSTLTGYIQFRGAPSKVREFASFLRQETEQASKFVSLNFQVVELNIDRTYEHSFSLSKLADFASTLQGVLDISSQGSVSSSEDGKVSLSISTRNSLSTLFKYISKFGNVKVVSSPTLVTANGIPAAFSFLKEDGWWVPGDLVQNYGIAGDNSNQQIQERPTWEDVQVGLKLVACPRMANNDSVLLDLYFSDSAVYAYSTTEWQQSQDVKTTLRKPLKSEKVLFNRSRIRKGQFLVLASLKQDLFQYNESFPRILNESKNRTKKYLFLVVSPYF